MKTDCKSMRHEFQEIHSRRVTVSFDGGRISSDAGGVLLRETDNRFRIIDQASACFTDHRHPDRIEHTVKELVGQRIFGLALGYEDLNDHDELRSDSLLAALVGKADLTGQNRRKSIDKGKPLAGKSTLNRLELPLNNIQDLRYKKIESDFGKIENLFVDLFIQMQQSVPKHLVLDLDATDDPLHGKQEGRFFNSYYRSYCYLPLYIFCGHRLLCAKLRSCNMDACEGTVNELQRIVTLLRRAWPKVKLTIRADSGFCRERIMNFCEQNHIDYVLGLAKNNRLLAEITEDLKQAKQTYMDTKAPARVFKDIEYKTRHSWSRSRRVVAKAEYLNKGANPRFIVTSESKDAIDAKILYEDHYCPRGDMENRIKEQQLCLFADRTSTQLMKSNQLRLWFSSLAYVLIDAMRTTALEGTKLAQAQCDTIRLKLFKIGALIKITVRRVWISMSSGYAYKDIFGYVAERLKT